MEAVAGSAAYGEAIVFLGCFRDFPDPRQRGKVIYPLEEVLLLCLLAVLAGAETFVDIARFGQKKIAFLRRFLPFRDGTPSHDHLGDIFATLDATEFQRRFIAWVAKLIGVSADVVAIDGKTLRGSAHKKGAKAAIHMVSAFAARQRLLLGQVKVADKSNEIIAIPALLDVVAIDGKTLPGSAHKKGAKAAHVAAYELQVGIAFFAKPVEESRDRLFSPFLAAPEQALAMVVDLINQGHKALFRGPMD